MPLYLAQQRDKDVVGSYRRSPCGHPGSPKFGFPVLNKPDQLRSFAKTKRFYLNDSAIAHLECFGRIVPNNEGEDSRLGFEIDRMTEIRPIRLGDCNGDPEVTH